MTEKGIEVVMNALAGTPTVVTADFANEVEQILREKIQIEKENGGNSYYTRNFAYWTTKNHLQPLPKSCSG